MGRLGGALVAGWGRVLCIVFGWEARGVAAFEAGAVFGAGACRGREDSWTVRVRHLGLVTYHISTWARTLLVSL